MVNQNNSIPDVETTNWNAVKLLATKYGIQLRSLEDIKVAKSASGTVKTTDVEGQGRELVADAREGSGVEDVEDLGLGTPFMITARAVEGGRVIYRFKWRGEEGASANNKRDSNERVAGEDSSETGYDPGSDSPSSSYGKSASKRKQASSRTLKTKRSIPGLRNVSSSGNLMGNNSTVQNEKKRAFTAETKDERQSPQKIQRGDVLGAILGLREGITAQDYSWFEGRRANEAIGKPRNAKGMERRMPGTGMKSHLSIHCDDVDSGWRSISPFGEPVLQRTRGSSIANPNDWQRSPIPRLTDFGQPLFGDIESSFDGSSEPKNGTVNPIEIGNQDGRVSDGAFIFDVLQRYTHKGIEPLDESITAAASSSSPIRARQASSSSDATNPQEDVEDHFQASSSISATPGDDPRFALWAVRSPDDDDALILSSRAGAIDHVPQSPLPTFASTTSPRTPSSGKRWSVRGPISNSSPSNDNTTAPASSPSFQESKHSMLFPSDSAFLIAASTSCLVAELTSRIDSRLLTDFFYTYRAYLSSHDLLRLLTLRFKWAMSNPMGPKDEARRKIVRVRTYVVLKYWLSNFFEIDFLPSRNLRRQLTDWLNTVGQDEQLPDLSIIKSLKKIVRGLKKVYEQAGVGGILLSSEAGQSPEMIGQDRFRNSNETPGSNQPDAAVNLEWGERSQDDDPSTPPARRMGEVRNTESWRSPAVSSVTSPLPPMHNPPPPLPLSQNAISRVFVNTVGKLSRFKRNLNSRTTMGGGSTPEGGFEGLEFEANDSGDLLFIRGGVENFINFFNLNVGSEEKSQPSEDELTSDSTTAQDETPSLSATSNQTSSTPASSIDLGSRGRSNEGAGAEVGLGISNDDSEVNLNQMLHTLPEDPIHLTKSNLAKTAPADHLHHFQSDQTLRSVSTVQPAQAEAAITASPSSGNVSASNINRHFSSPKGPGNIVQIDDIDLSSDEDDGMVRRALRRLPGARDLRMANHVRDLEISAGRASLDSMASFGRVYPGSQQSLSSYYQRGSSIKQNLDELQLAPLTGTETPKKFGIVETEMLDPDEALRGYELVKGFRLDQLDDSDDEEPGDVEAALRRLEGFIDEDKQKEKTRRVEAMWLRSQAERQQEEEEETAKTKEGQALNRQSAPSVQQRSIIEQDEEEGGVEIEDKATADSAPSISPTKSTKKRPVTQGGMLLPSVRHSTTKRNLQRSEARAPTALPSRLWAPPAPVHRSFLLNYRSEVIAQQFCLIESELFKAVTWQELVSDQWKQKHFTGQVLDWESFYQASVRRKAEARKRGERNSFQDTSSSNVEAIVARFNLTCNWVASEVVLTRQIDDRAAVICKLIRIAWKCYHHSNFATLTQIILGLQSPWIERLSKTWSRVGMLEMRMLRDLKAFINPARNFKHLRTSMRNMIIEGGMEDLVTSSGPPRSANSSNINSKSTFRLTDGCIPFFGLFLSDLAVNDTLPTFIEPSSPNSKVDYDPTTGHLLTLQDPNAFAHLAPLPAGISLSPLVNLYKSRITAITVKSVLAFQERLNSYNLQADANVYVKTLRIRCLEGEQLTQISHLVEP